MKKIIWSGFYFALIAYTCIRLANDSVAKMKFWERPWSTTAIEFFGAFLISCIIILGIKWMTIRFNKKDFKSPRHQIAFEVRSVLLWSVIIGNLIGNPWTAYTDDGWQISDAIINNLIIVPLTVLYFLYDRVNYYSQAFVNASNRSRILREEKLEAELQYLKAQINPHFLFNALNSIYFLIEEEPKQAQHSLDRFSGMLRYQLYDCTAHKVPLNGELNYLKDYMALERMRKTTRLKLEEEWPTPIPNLLIAPFLLQPLIENAFKFVGGAELIQMKSGINEKRFEFSIYNSIGELPTLNKMEGGIGLANLKKRLSILYPQKHHFSIDQTSDHFIAKLSIELDEA